MSEEKVRKLLHPEAGEVKDPTMIEYGTYTIQYDETNEKFLVEYTLDGNTSKKEFDNTEDLAREIASDLDKGVELCTRLIKHQCKKGLSDDTLRVALEIIEELRKETQVSLRRVDKQIETWRKSKE